MDITELHICHVAFGLNLEEAFSWCSKQRRAHSCHNSIWDLRRNWPKEKKRIQSALLKGCYQLQPLRQYQIGGSTVTSWEASDAVVLKAVALALGPFFSSKTYPHCTHVKTGGGLHGALERLGQKRDEYQHILKSDIHHYYASINHEVLSKQLSAIITCPILLDLIMQYATRVEIKEGQYFHQNQGIPRGCPLSPLISALYLKPLDDALSQHGFYVRYMDDWVLLVKTKRQLRKVVRLTHQVLKTLKLKMHPDKTFIGRIQKGFNFLGVHFGATICIAKQTIENHYERLAQRYAQVAAPAAIGIYLSRWSTWCHSILRRAQSNARCVHYPPRLHSPPDCGGAVEAITGGKYEIYGKSTRSSRSCFCP